MTLSSENATGSKDLAVSADRHRAIADLVRAPASLLPSWPFTALFALLPVWWLIGAIDFIWFAAAAVMGLYLLRSRAVSVPRGFGFWLLFIIWSSFAAVHLDTLSRLVGFTYRQLLYVAATVIFLYLYNARRHITSQRIAGTMTIYWLTTVAGGYLGLLFPTGSLRTPLSYLMPSGLLNNELVNLMVVRTFAQFDPEAWGDTAPRPTAPFHYTNNWGNAYSMLLPFVLLYLIQVRGQRRFWLLLAALPISLVPAFLTLNRGMFIGLAIALVYAAVRLALQGHRVGVAVIALAGLAAAFVFILTPAQERLTDRLESSSSTTTRASTYSKTWEETKESPIFGHGAPRPSQNPNAPPIGSQGHFWIVLFSFGVGGALLFVGWFAAAFIGTIKRPDPVGLTCNTVLAVALVELFYYGLLPYGLPIIVTAAALGLRPLERAVPAARPTG